MEDCVNGKEGVQPAAHKTPLPIRSTWPDVLDKG